MEPPQIDGIRKCSVCKNTLPLSEFTRNRSMKDGIDYKCRPCGKKLWAKYREKNAEKLALSQKMYRELNPEKRKEVKRRSVQKPKSRFLAAIATARRRGLCWEISREFFDVHLNSVCTYCGGSLPKTGHGFDRINNAVGYIESNIVACCFRCNLIRGTNLSYEEMKALGPALGQTRLNRLAIGEEW